PEQTLELRRPDWATDPKFTPDRRLGLTIDLDFGTVRLVAGAYDSARIDDLRYSALLLAGRLLVEPIGPVGNRLSTVADAPVWRRRARFGVNLSFLYLYDWRSVPAPEFDPSGYA